jgi:hypothetical protein
MALLTAKREDDMSKEELKRTVEKWDDPELLGDMTWEQKVIHAAMGEIGVIRGMTDKIEAMLDLIMENVPDPEAKPQESPKGKDELMEEMADLTDLAEQIHGLAEGFEYRLEKALKAKAQAPQAAPDLSISPALGAILDPLTRQLSLFEAMRAIVKQDLDGDPEMMLLSLLDLAEESRVSIQDKLEKWAWA